MIEQILEILFGVPEGVTLGIGPLALVGAGVQLFGGLMGAGKARRQARAMERKQRQYQSQLESLEKNRQRIVNPYADIEDMSSTIQNPFANLQVATQAAEMKAEEADISLAGTLDVLRATGAGAAGATALAQSALRSKRGIAADIEKQEMRNAELRAQGEQKMQQLRQAERARVQTLMGRGEEFRMRMQEGRETARLDRLSGLAEQYGAQAASARQQSSAMFGQALGAIGGTLLSAGLSGGLGGNKQTFAQGQGSGFTPTASTFVQDANMDLYNTLGSAIRSSNAANAVKVGSPNLSLMTNTNLSGFNKILG